MRVIIIVLDSVGIGALPDAALYKDEGANTLMHIKEAVPEMSLPNMTSMGLAHIEGCEGICESAVYTITPKGCFGRLEERSRGKDTTTGHWEIAGVVTKDGFPLYPDGFPKDLMHEFERRTGCRAIGNCAASGTEIISRLGNEHLGTGALIVYTSADSVFQIAAHEGLYPPNRLYEICDIARELLTGEHGVSRVIARPFVGEPGKFKRTENRKDFSLAPSGDTTLDIVKEAGMAAAAVGKIEDIFAGRGITKAVHIKNNMQGVDETLKYMDDTGDGIIFTNLVDFDMLYGHRNDAPGYAKALMDFDSRLPEVFGKLRPDDMLIITADHGCDPVFPGTDHTREYIPLLACGERVRAGACIGTRRSFADIDATVLQYLGIQRKREGESFLNTIIK